MPGLEEAMTMLLDHHPPGHRRRWDDADDAALRRLVAAGEYLGDIARAMGRTQEACRSRANILKLAVRSAPMRPRD
jgi:hypothetical protein